MLSIAKPKVFGFLHGVVFITTSLAVSWLALANSSSSNQSSTRPQFILPVKCEIGQSCLVQKLVDHDSTSERRDYRCGKLTTDGHDGTDIRLRTLEDMRLGFAVVAAASGTVLRTRDGEPDISARLRPETDGKEAGNGMVIDHGDGWQTQYSHLKKGSISVKPGQRIVAGTPLGLIGLSGNTEFPHLHFSVRHRGVTVDPFTGDVQGSDCANTSNADGLWTEGASRALQYAPTAIISVGLSSSMPSKLAMTQTNDVQPPSTTAPIFLWADVIGAMPGDVQTFSITGPDGRLIHSQQIVVKDGGLSWFAYSGKRAPATRWQSGRYIGTYSINRQDVRIGAKSANVLLK